MKAKKLNLVILTILVAGLMGAEAEEGPASSSEQAWIAPEQVTPARLQAVFEKKRWTVKEEKNGIAVGDSLDRVVMVQIYPDKGLICLAMWFKFQRSALNYQKLRFINEINREVVFTRAQIDEDGDLRFDYWLRYDQGLTEEQLLSAFNYFLDSSIAALRLKDTRDLIK